MRPRPRFCRQPGRHEGLHSLRILTSRWLAAVERSALSTGGLPVKAEYLHDWQGKTGSLGLILRSAWAASSDHLDTTRLLENAGSVP